MDYAVIRSGGKQYRVHPGETIRVEKLPAEAGSSFVFTDVLLTASDAGLKVGKPLLDEARVTGEILRHEQAKKILVFKKKRRKNYRRRQGHRQQLTVVRVTGIEAGAAPAGGEEHGA